MTAIDVVIPRTRPRRWQLAVAERLKHAGHDVSIVLDDGPDAWPPALDRVLGLERRVLGTDGDDLVEAVDPVAGFYPGRRAELTIDLAGSGNAAGSPVLAPSFDGDPSPAGAARALIAGRLPDVAVALDGQGPVAKAAPMVDSRMSVARGLNDVLARAATLIVATVGRLAEAEDCAAADPGFHQNAAPAANTRGLLGSYALSALPRQAGEAFRRLRYHAHHWRVGYRFHDGRGVAETGLLAGAPWTVLADAGDRFYADPFPFEWRGRHFMFVEECPHATGKGVISVAEIFADGSASVPRVVLEEPHHLSYPQVFARGGQIWMIPEGGAGHSVVLYRAEHFPDRWVPHRVLIENRELFDATLLDHGGRLWLFATERDGYGSASDTMVIFRAPDLEGPWLPHPMNPVMIDRAAARPGGAFVKTGDRIVLPVQDGTRGYGGGLGLSDLLELDEKHVRLTRPVPILGTPGWPYPRIHTLNRAGRLETIDGIADVPKRGARSRRAA